MNSAGFGLEVQDLEPSEGIGRAGLRLKRINPGQRRRLLLELLQEGLQAILRAVDLDLHPTGGITDPTGQLVAYRETIHKGSKADSLNDPAYPNLQPGKLAHHTCRGAAILERNQSAQASMPSPVLQETAKVVNPGLSISTP